VGAPKNHFSRELPMLKKRLLAVITVSGIIALLAGCGPASTTSTTTPAITITFADLTANPAQYNNKTVTITGFWFDGFEIEVLAERLDPSTFTAGNVEPAGTTIWVFSGLPQEISNQLYTQSNNATGYAAHYGKVELTGKLEYGGHYGQMNSYDYQLTVQSAKWIDWKP
jgi:hypothetical protein